MLLVSIIQEVVAGDPAATITVQVVMAALIPAFTQILKAAIPGMEGKRLLYANMAMNILVALGMIFGAGAPAVATGAVGLSGGFAGSKIVDLKKHGQTLSARHRR